MRVYLTEKPSQQSDVARAVGLDASRPAPPGTIAVRDGLVIAAQGHLLELAEPHEINPTWKQWTLDVLPMVPAAWRKRPIRGRERRLRTATEILRTATEIVIATDAGREGELIAREILDHARVRPGIPVQRMWATAMNQKKLREALAKLLPGERTAPMAISGLLRQQSDYLEGLNLTRTLSLRSGARNPPASVGRVQTPTLALLVHREQAIERFKPETFYTLEATLRTTDGAATVTLRHDPRERITERDTAQAIAAAARQTTAPIGVERERKHQAPPPPFELQTLGAQANRLWGWTAARTLEVAQSLYDEKKAITYPRTDWNAYDATEWDDAMEVLDALAARGDALAAHVPAHDARPHRPKVFRANAPKDTDHDAIKPTVDLDADLNDDERRLFDLIAERFVAQFLSDWSFDQTTMHWDVAEARFAATGRVTVDEGWRALRAPRTPGAHDTTEPDPELGEEPDAPLPPIAHATLARAQRVDVTAGQTKPPQRFTEGKLTAEMKKLKIGTKATWDAIIETLKRRTYVTALKRHLIPTPRGRAIVDWLDRHWPSLTDPATTARLEERLDAVEQGAVAPSAVLDDMVRRTTEGVALMKSRPPPAIPGLAPATPAPGRWSFTRSRTDPSRWDATALLEPDTGQDSLTPGAAITIHRRDDTPSQATVAELLEWDTHGEAPLVRARVAIEASGASSATRPRREPGVWSFARPSDPTKGWEATAELPAGTDKATLRGQTIAIRRQDGTERQATVTRIMLWRPGPDTIYVRVLLERTASSAQRSSPRRRHRRAR